MKKVAINKNYQDAFDKLEAAIIKEISTGGKILADEYSETKSFFYPGIYMRRMFLPQGMIITGKIHKTLHPFILSLGNCIVYSPEHPEGVNLTAPFHGTTQKGTRRLIIALEDMMWTEIHPNPDNCTDEAILEERLIKKHKNKYLTLELNK